MTDYNIEQKSRFLFEKPKYTQTPNVLFDELMKDMGEAELKITLCIIRKIIGYHKVRPEAVSLSQIQTMTGLSRQGTLDGVEKVEKRGLIRKAGVGKRGVTLYELVYSDENSELVKPVDQSSELTRTSQASRPELVKPVDTQKKVVKEKNKDNPIFDWVSINCFKLDPHNDKDKLELKRNAGRVGKIVSYLMEKETSISLLNGFKVWYKNQFPTMHLPRDDAKFSNHYKNFADSIDIKPSLETIATQIFTENNLATDGVIQFNRKAK